jgi:hypothetical protein
VDRTQLELPEACSNNQLNVPVSNPSLKSVAPLDWPAGQKSAEAPAAETFISTAKVAFWTETQSEELMPAVPINDCQA